MTAGLGHGQTPKKRDVELTARGPNFSGRVDQAGDGFVAEHYGKDNRYEYKHNFRSSAGRMRVGGRYMAYDPEGRSKDVLAREDGDGEDTRWETEKPARGLGVCLRVPKGPLKGWWVGLGPAEPAKGGRPARAKLVLVKDKKDAAVFRWPDPWDEGP
jgi:hypothetical protein